MSFATALLHVGVAIVGILFLWSSPLVTLALAVVSLVSLIAEQAARGVWLSRCCVQSPSQNVVAVIPSVGTAVARMILCGHYDTQRPCFFSQGSGWNDSVWMPRSRRLP